MNLIHLKYIITIAEQGSLGRAAEVLTVAQPNLSRAVKEMEADLGIRIFNRTPKGMTLTPDGETFLNSAHKIIDQIDTIKTYYSTKGIHRRVLTVSAPAAPTWQRPWPPSRKTCRENLPKFSCWSFRPRPG